MISRAVYPKRSGRRWLTALAVLSLITGTMVVGSGALALTQSEFELDKNATGNLATLHLGASKSAIKSTAATNSFINCEIVGVTYPTPPFTIMIDSEVMTVTSFGATSSATGGCGFSDPALVASQTRVYNVTRTNRAAHPGGSDVTQLISGALDGDDWDQVYDQVRLDANDIGADDQCLALGAVECAWIHDGFGVSVFTGGSKDDLDLDQWGHTDSSVPPSDEILDAFAAKYQTATAELLFFGADRWSTNGAKDFGFWFFQNPVIAEPDGTFGDAVHTVGDILILGTFSQGGAVATIRVFSWAGLGQGDTNGVLDTEGNFGDCVPGGGTGPGCNTVNDTTIPSPWAYQGSGSTQVPGVIYSGGFIEGGINLTELGLTGCFSSFMAETRSSPSISAQLKDFVLGTFESCQASIVTDASLDTLEIGGSITDTATLSVTGPAPTGVVDFYVCGPSTGTTSCDATGTAAGSINLSTATVSGDDYTVTSDSVTPTSAGDYCFYAEYPAGQDTNFPAGAFPIDSTNECFTVTEAQPAILTVATSATADLLGTVIDDTATLSGTADQPDGDPAGGTITFTAYGPFDALNVCTGTAVYTSVVAVSGDGDYTASDGDADGDDILGEVPDDQFIPTAAGTYNWIAVYSGDSPNTLGIDGLCADENEGSVIEPNQPTISTVATGAAGVALGSVIDDTATLSGTADQPDGDPAGGTITFTAYGPFDALNVCTGTAVYTSVVAVSGDGDYTASDGDADGDDILGEVPDDQFIPTAAGTYNWIAVYSGDSPNTLGIDGLCADENEGSVVISLQPTIDTAQTFVLHDDATITVTSGAGGDLSGSVRFRLYNNATCDDTVPTDLLYDSNVNFSTGIAVSGSGTFPQLATVSSEEITITTSAPTLSWLVEYSSDNPAHENVTSACNVENSSVSIDNG